MSDIRISEEEFHRLKAAAGEPIRRPTPCAEKDHIWKSIGGANAGCCDECGCSVPAHRCVICGADDCGENDEGDDILRSCEDRVEMEAERALEDALAEWIEV